MTSPAQAVQNPDARRAPIKLGVLLAVASETMLFAGLISSYIIFRADNPGWPPLGQPRLPVAATAVNTLFLLASAWTLWRGLRLVSAGRKAGAWVGATAALGLMFVLLQGGEWAALLAQGLGMRANPYGAFFYTIVGMHALHVVVAAALCLRVALRCAAGVYTAHNMDGLTAFSYFWYFVVGLWPVLYAMVYLW